MIIIWRILDWMGLIFYIFDWGFETIMAFWFWVLSLPQGRRERGRAPVKKSGPLWNFFPFWAPNSYLDSTQGPKFLEISHFQVPKTPKYYQKWGQSLSFGPFWVSGPGKNNRLYPLYGPGLPVQCNSLNPRFLNIFFFFVRKTNFLVLDLLKPFQFLNK